MDLSYTNDTSRRARFKRELRNPSMVTVMLLVLLATAVVVAPFAPGWVTTTREGFDALAEGTRLEQERARCERPEPDRTLAGNPGTNDDQSYRPT